MLQMHRHQLRAVIGTSNVKVSKRKFTFNRSLIEFRLINIIVINNVYDPLGNVIKTETVDDPDKFTDFQISKSCTQGRDASGSSSSRNTVK